MEHFSFNKVCKLYLKTNDELLSKNSIKDFFNELKNNPEKASPLYNGKTIIQEEVFPNSGIFYSFCAFMIKQHPVNLHDINDVKWMETKLAYILIIEYSNFVIINKKYFSNLKQLIKNLNPLDYKVLSKLFDKQTTIYKRFGMKNTDISNTAIRNRSIESENLKNNLLNINLNQYVLNSCKLSDKGEIFSIALNNSKITNLNHKVNLEDYCNWALEICNEIKNLSYTNNSLIDLFAIPVDFKVEKDHLTPNYILIDYQSIENLEEYDCIKFHNRSLPEEYIDKLKESIRFSFPVEELKYTTVKKTQNRLKLNSSFYNQFFIEFNNGKEHKKLIDYINEHNLYTISFENIEYKYMNGKLFKDTHLRTNINSFLTIFEPHKELNTIISEKGKFSPSDTEFKDDCEFGFVEKNFSTNYNYFICDDLGNEWADHIGLCYDEKDPQNNKISFFHSKTADRKFSASAFEEVVGQALKNIGNITPLPEELNAHQKKWNNKFYNNNKVQTKINILRNGTSINDAITTWNNIMKMPFYQKEIYLVINFISKKNLEDYIQKLNSVNDSREKKTYIQILWLLSSLVAQCREQNITVKILCKE